MPSSPPAILEKNSHKRTSDSFFCFLPHVDTREEMGEIEKLTCCNWIGNFTIGEMKLHGFCPIRRF